MKIYPVRILITVPIVTIYRERLLLKVTVFQVGRHLQNDVLVD